MIIVMKKGAPKEASEKLRKSLEQRGFTIHDSIGENQEVLGIGIPAYWIRKISW